MKAEGCGFESHLGQRFFSLSFDLRWRVVWQYTVNHATIPDIAQLLSLSQSTVYRYLQRFHHTGDVKPETQRHGPRKLLGELEQVEYKLCGHAILG